MKVLNLRCSRDHRFEGWFASEDDYRSQDERGLMVCPMCGDQTIARLPSAPHIGVARARPPVLPEQQEGGRSAGVVAGRPAPSEATSNTTPVASAPSRELTLQSIWMQAVRQVIANTDDVGDRFAEEARRIHYGEADERAIRGQATRDEAEALRDEGIEVMALPMPAALKDTLQ